MGKAANSINKVIAPAHRAVWRFGTFILLLMVNQVATAPVGHRSAALGEPTYLLILYALIVPYEIFNIAREYRHPRPSSLGMSENALLMRLTLVASCFFLTLDWIIVKHDQVRSEWPWALLVWAAALAIYLLRPRFHHSK
jgi:hypothetical protein